MTQSFHTFYRTPCDALSPYIDRYWGWERDGQISPHMPKVLPGTGMEVFFHYGDQFAVENSDRPGSDGLTILPHGHSMQLRRCAWQLAPNMRTGFIAIRFRGGAFRHFCPYAAAETQDRFLDVRDLWGPEGSDMLEQVLEAKTLTSRIAIIERYLLRFLTTFRRDEAKIDHAIQHIYYGGPERRLDTLIDELDISPRHLQRTFKQAMGASPKAFQRLTRFQNTVKHLLLRKQPDYLEPALAFGYYDQAHFIKEFHSFTGETPTRFFREQNFMAHFYNTSLPGSPTLTLTQAQRP